MVHNPPGMTKEPVRQPRSRLAPEARKAQIVDAAAALIVQQGLLPVQLDVLSRGLGISKGLIYSYFPTQYDLVNAVLRRHLLGLLADGLETMSRESAPDALAEGCSTLYFEQVAANGPLLHIVFTDLYMAGHVDPDLAAAAARVVRRLARALRREVGLSAGESLAALSMLTAIPEEAGSLVFNKQTDHDLGRELCAEIMAGALDYLRAAQNDRRRSP